MAESLHDEIERQRGEAFPEASDLKDFRDYARGRQTATLTPDQRRVLASVANHRFADNVVRMILAAAASRLELTGFLVDDQTATGFLADLWTKNQVADLQYDAHFATLRDGNHAVSLRWQATAPEDADRFGPGRVVLRRERWWDGATGVFVAYDDLNRPTYAVKDFRVWMGDPPRKRLRRTVWFPDRIERYLKEGQGWAPFPLPGDDLANGATWTKADGSPLGIPVAHFANGSDDDAPYGSSDLDGGVIGVQDELNDIQRDVTAAARLTGFQMLAATGVKLEKDASGRTKPLVVGPGRTFSDESPDAKFYPIPAGDMGKLTASYDHKLQTITRMTDTPIHLITGNWPSGAALLRAEMPLVSKVQRLAKTVGPAWATVAHRSTEIANAFGGLGIDEDALITAVFAPPEKLDALALAEVDKARVDVYARLEDISDPVLMAKTGLVTEDEAAAIVAGRQERAASLPVLAEF